MASAELLKITRSVDDRVKDVQGDVQDVRGDVQDARCEVQDVGNKVQGVSDSVQGIGSDVKVISSEVRGVDEKLDQVNRSLSLYHLLIILSADGFTGNQLKDNLFRWLSPPDPSINHNIACKTHHSGTAQWFFQGSIFEQWKSTDSFLWIHGKRALIFAFTV